jgi:hypothetical protein
MITITVLPPTKKKSAPRENYVPACDPRDIRVLDATVKWGSACVLRYSGGLLVRLPESWVLPGGKRTNDPAIAQRVCEGMAWLMAANKDYPA